MSKNKNTEEINLNKYQDLGGLTLKKMNFGLWLAEHRIKLIKYFIAFLIVISACFFIYSTYSYIQYFLTSASDKDDAANNQGNVVFQRNIVTDLIIGSPQIFHSGENYDLAVLLKNPNDKFAAYFKFCFLNNGGNISCNSGYILPAEEKYLLALGKKIDSGAPQVSFKITETSWRRIDNHTIPDWTSYAKQRLNFNLEDIHLAPANESGLSEKIGLDSLEFTITNRSDYGYYEVPLNIAFYNGNELVGVNRYVVKNFLAGETRSVKMSWPGGLSSNTRTDIRPELNLLDNNIYQNYQGTQ